MYLSGVEIRTFQKLASVLLQGGLNVNKGIDSFSDFVVAAILESKG